MALPGPIVTRASLTSGQLRLAVSFHKAGVFTADVFRLTGRTGRFVRDLSVGRHPAGPAHLTLTVGALAPGRYAVVVTPHPVTRLRSTPGVTKTNRATWVGFTITKRGVGGHVALTS